MSTLDEMHRFARIKTLARILTNAAEERDKNVRSLEQIAEVEPENIAVAMGQVMVDMNDSIIEWAIAYLDEENAFDGIESSEGKIIRAYLLAGDRHPDHKTEYEQVKAMLGLGG